MSYSSFTVPRCSVPSRSSISSSPRRECKNSHPEKKTCGVGPRPFPAVGDQKEIHVVKKLFSFFALSLRQTFPIRSPPSLPPSAPFLSLFRLLLSFILPCLCLCIYLIGQARRGIEKKGETTKRVVVEFLSPLPFLFISFHSSKERGKIPQSPFRCFFFRGEKYKKSGKERQTRPRHFPLLLGTKCPDIGRSFMRFQSFSCGPGSTPNC